MKNYVVTVARGFGTGGKVIASKLAADLGIHCYENRILTLASQLSGLDKKLFEHLKIPENTEITSDFLNERIERITIFDKNKIIFTDRR